MKTKKTEKRTHRQFSAEEKSQAVLSLWMERRKPAEICRELSVTWTTLNNWQNRALEAMLQALEPKAAESKKSPALGPRLEKLFAQRGKPKPSTVQTRLNRRLDAVQAPAQETKA